MKEEKILTGVYRGSGRGFGFLIPDGAQSRSEDCFVPPHQEHGAWDGDRVEGQLEPEDPNQPGRRIARITGILERGVKQVTGTVHKAVSYTHLAAERPPMSMLTPPTTAT